MFVFAFRSSLAKIEPFLNPSLFFDSNGKRISFATPILCND